MNRKINKILAKRKQKVAKRLERKNWENQTKFYQKGVNSFITQFNLLL